MNPKQINMPKVITSAGVEIYYEVSGSGPECILLINGTVYFEKARMILNSTD